jgi:hypothetical protein
VSAWGGVVNLNYGAKSINMEVDALILLRNPGKMSEK